MRWLDAPPDCLAFTRDGRSGDLICVLNTGEQAAELPIAGELLITSTPGATVRDGALQLPARTAVWLRC